MNIGGIVIAYNAGEDFENNIRSYLPFVNCLIIAENSQQIFPFSKEILENEKIILIHDGENKGIAARLNQSAEILMNKGFDWLLTMDQDSYFEKNQIENYLEAVEIFPDKDKVSMFGVEYEKANFTEKKSLEVNLLITSGSIVNLKLLNEIGGFDEQLFIDEVDLEYCYRSVVKGFKIIKFPFIFLQHHLGETGSYVSLKSLKKTNRPLHSSLRIYYMIRNFLYVKKKYPNQFLHEDKIRKKALLTRIKNNLLYGKTRLKTIQMINKAFFDFKRNKMGKI